jgi:hypothetical protein
MLDEDTPQWEHTITAMVKLRQRNSADDPNQAWELAKDDEESWYVVSIDWDNVTNSDTIRKN